MKDSPAGYEDKSSHILLGNCGEDIACSFMLRHGYAILDRNWRFKHLELDIVCEKDNQIIFVEVKTRRTNRLGGPSGAISPQKKEKLLIAAQAWLQAHDAWQKPCRIDIICLVGEHDHFKLEHYANAFEFSTLVDCGNTSGKYW